VAYWHACSNVEQKSKTLTCSTECAMKIGNIVYKQIINLYSFIWDIFSNSLKPNGKNMKLEIKLCNLNKALKFSKIINLNDFQILSRGFRLLKFKNLIIVIAVQNIKRRHFIYLISFNHKNKIT
jgi:hypothetical protein